MNATVLVTGSAGYVGSHTVLCLREKGFRVVGLDDLSNGWRDLADLADAFEEVDLTHAGGVEAVFERHDIDAIVHCAGLAVVPESLERPEAYYRVNVGGTANLLAAARRHSALDFVFSSSAAVYGIPDTPSIDETSTPTKPINPYGDTKLVVEQMLWAARHGWGLRPVAFRYFNAAGADALRRAGEDHRRETHLIPNILKPLASGDEEPTVRVFGNDYETRDGTCVRDYVHVDDLAEAHAAGLDYVRSHPEGGVFNLGTGRGYSVLEVVKAAQDVTGRRFAVEIQDRRPGDPPRLVASHDRATSVLGWRPTHSGLEEILETAWRWHQVRHGT